MYLLYQRRLFLLVLQKWQESIGQSKEAEIVRGKLCLHKLQVDRLGLGKVKAPLNTRVQDDTVEISVGFGDTGPGECQAVIVLN